MIAPLLEIALQPVVARQRRLRQYRGWASVWLGAVALIGLLFLVSKLTGWSWSPAPVFIALLAGLAGLIVFARARRWQPDYALLARRIEQQHPEVHDLLRTAVEQKSESGAQLSYLQRRVISEAVQLAEDSSWIDSVPTGQLAGVQAVHWVALAGLVLLLLNLPQTTSSGTPFSVETAGVEVTPGDTTLERGTGLAILARFQGELPATVDLVVTPDAVESRRIPLNKSLDDPVFGATLASVEVDTRYRVEYDGQEVGPFTIRVFDYPSLERADAELTYPVYTGLSPKRIEDTRRISAVEGTRVDYHLQLNKPTAQARLVSKDQPTIELAADTNRASLTLTNFVVSDNATYQLQLVDTDGRTNKTPANFVFQALKNRSPELKLVFPRGDQRVSPIQQVNFDVETWDDFGLTAAGISVRVGLAEPRSIVLAEGLAANQKTNFVYQLQMEEYQAQPDDLVSYYVWADDIGPDGETRRTESDLFFAEVRPFEEIFREDESQQSQEQAGAAGAGSQQGEQTDQLIEIQKQIITASWNLHRRRAEAPPPEPFQEDVQVVLDSQQEALEQARTLQQRAGTEEARRLLQDTDKAMSQAASDLEEALEQPAKLTDALSQEQAAYQALLKLQAHEFRVTQSRSQASQGSQSSRNRRRQLDQLELRQSENRYATENQAQAQQNPAQREQLQVLNRLRELARRQEDINERLKELQTALQEAQTEEEREEIRRRLRHLREEQQEMLANVDELIDRMNRPENQAQMAEAREQLEQTRSQVQDAAESLEGENVPEALTAGTRAERDLEDLRDDFRQQNSSQFTEDMRQMRQEARDLASQQEEIARQMENILQEDRKTLTDTPAQAEVRQALAQQGEGVTNLLQHMTQVTQAAEGAEPLLARQLYDTLRRAHQSSLNESLEIARQLVENSLIPQARPFEQEARRQLDDLRRGVESAAQSVLGDDTEALRLARSELESLTRQVEEEMPTRAAGGQAGTNDMDRAAAEGAAPNANAQAPGEEPRQLAQNRAASQAGQQQGEGQRASQPEDPQQAQAGQQGTEGQQGPQPGEGQQQGGQGQSEQAAAQDGQGQAQAQGQGQGEGQNQDQQTAQASAPNQQPSQQQGQGQGQGQGGQGQRQENQQAQTGQGQGGPRDTGGARFFDQRGPDSNQGGGSGPSSGPLLGEDYREWSDRMRNVEELLQEPDQRAEASMIRERVRNLRTESRRHGKEPQWDLVRTDIIEPMIELQKQVQEELTRRQSQQAIVPIDRDPVPRAYAEFVRRYYERLGQGD